MIPSLVEWQPPPPRKLWRRHNTKGCLVVTQKRQTSTTPPVNQTHNERDKAISRGGLKTRLDDRVKQGFYTKQSRKKEIIFQVKREIIGREFGGRVFPSSQQKLATIEKFKFKAIFRSFLVKLC
ncbi:hypothetical protein OIU85_012530 [Salix viminalis]|uniref:Uncharacterized protein n=1 Tax=Salix viminalis TaxID=40686 RepID=A0A9Q0SDB3_SALVM|nr:hypothetical protein OIU85_012530 [Salix viminalis]